MHKRQSAWMAVKLKGTTTVCTFCIRTAEFKSILPPANHKVITSFIFLGPNTSLCSHVLMLQTVLNMPGKTFSDKCGETWMNSVHKVTDTQLLIQSVIKRTDLTIMLSGLTPFSFWGQRWTVWHIEEIYIFISLSSQFKVRLWTTQLFPHRTSPEQDNCYCASPWS